MSATWPADDRSMDLVRQRGGELLRAAVLRAGSRPDAEDALQEAAISVSRAWPSRLLGFSEAAAVAYLRQAVLRRAINGLRRPRPARELEDRAMEDLLGVLLVLASITAGMAVAVASTPTGSHDFAFIDSIGIATYSPIKPFWLIGTYANELALLTLGAGAAAIVLTRPRR